MTILEKSKNQKELNTILDRLESEISRTDRLSDIVDEIGIRLSGSPHPIGESKGNVYEPEKSFQQKLSEQVFRLNSINSQFEEYVTHLEKTI